MSWPNSLYSPVVGRQEFQFAIKAQKDKGTDAGDKPMHMRVQRIGSEKDKALRRYEGPGICPGHGVRSEAESVEFCVI